MLKKIAALLAMGICVAPAGLMAAEHVPCINTFYQTKDMGCVDEYIAEMAKLPAGKIKDNGASLGFLAVIFSAYPAEREQILHRDAPSEIKYMYLEALYMADLMQDAQKYAEATGLVANLIGLQAHHPITLETAKPPYSIPSGNDFLIGAYMASGNTEYIRRILRNFSSADDVSAGDAIRISLVQARFGDRPEYEDRLKTLIVTACERYECKKNNRDFMHIMTLSSAFWALGSLAQTDEGIKKTVNDFFNDNPHLKNIATAEQIAFDNYALFVAAHGKTKDNPMMESYTTAYEYLSPISGLLAIRAKKNAR